MKQSQGRQLIALLKRKQMTTMEMLQTGISTSPWKRIAESLSWHEQLTIVGHKVVNGRKINIYRVVAATRWTA